MNNLKSNKSHTAHLQRIRKHTTWRQSGNKCDGGGFSG